MQASSTQSLVSQTLFQIFEQILHDRLTFQMTTMIFLIAPRLAVRNVHSLYPTNGLFLLLDICFLTRSQIREGAT